MSYNTKSYAGDIMAKKCLYILPLAIALIGTHVHSMESDTKKSQESSGKKVYRIPKSLISQENKKEKLVEVSAKEVEVSAKEAQVILYASQIKCKQGKGCIDFKKLESILCRDSKKGVTHRFMQMSQVPWVTKYQDGPCKGIEVDE